MTSLSHTIKQSFSEAKKNKFDYLFFFYNLVFFVGVFKQLESDDALIINFLIVLFIVFVKRKMSIKGIVPVLGLFTLILIIPTFRWGFSGGNVYIGFYIRILTAFLMISYFRVNFFKIFENILFILALISLPLFLIQMLNINFFNLFTDFSESVLNEERLVGRGVLESHRYLIVFLVNGWAENRNSGFAWEPAGFGALLAWASMFNLAINKMKMNPKLLVFIITSITTFSIGTYVATLIFLFFLIYNVKAIKKVNYIFASIVFILVLFSFTFINDMKNFMTGKADIYIESVESEQHKRKSGDRANRVTGALAGIALMLKSPLGYGLDPQAKTGFIISPNGFINLMFKYGLLGGVLIIILLVKIYVFLKKFFYPEMKGMLLFILVFFLTFNGNPFYHQPFFMALLLSGFLNLKIYGNIIMNSNGNKHITYSPINPV